MTGDCVCGSLFMKIYSNFLNIYYSFTRLGNEADDFIRLTSSVIL